MAKEPADRYQDMAAFHDALWAAAQEIARVVKPGGALVYAVCSLEPEEGEQQIIKFLKARTDAHTMAPDVAATQIPADCITQEGYVRTLPCGMSEKGGMDGFFAVCLEKI